MTGATPRASGGYYTVDAHDGNAPKQVKFTTNSKGQWVGNVRVPLGSEVRIVLPRFGRGSCSITQPGAAGQADRTIASGFGICTATPT